MARNNLDKVREAAVLCFLRDNVREIGARVREGDQVNGLEAKQDRPQITVHQRRVRYVVEGR